MSDILTLTSCQAIFGFTAESWISCWGAFFLAVVLIHIWLKKAALDTVPVDPDVVVTANNVSFDELLSNFIKVSWSRNKFFVL